MNKYILRKEYILRHRCYKRDKFKCSRCGCKVLAEGRDTHLATVEPIIPINKGGDYDRTNLITVCLGCNTNKGAWQNRLNANLNASYVRVYKGDRSKIKRLRKKARKKLHKLLDKYGNKCYLCGKNLRKKHGKKNSRTIDHVKPISKGGNNDLDNLRLCCFSCNQKKGNDD